MLYARKGLPKKANDVLKKVGAFKTYLREQINQWAVTILYLLKQIQRDRD